MNILRHSLGLFATVLSALLASCADSCGKDGHMAAAIRSLSDQQRAQLLHEAATIQCPKAGYCDLPTLQQLDIQWQRHRGFHRYRDRGSIVLGMCFDYGIDLRFEALGQPDARIVLSYGEAQQDYGEEIIWPRADSE